MDEVSECCFDARITLLERKLQLLGLLLLLVGTWMVYKGVSEAWRK